MGQVKFHKVNEHILLPVLFILNTMSVMALIYFINELFAREAYLKEFYLFDANGIVQYREQTTYLIVALGIVLVAQGMALKYRNWLFSAFLIIVNSVLLVLCIGYA